MTNTTNANAQPKAYNISIKGFGYINRVREVNVERGQPYLALDVALMEGVVREGDYSGINKTYLSATVKGAKAKQILRDHFTTDGVVKSPEVPVTASMNLGGLVPSTFKYERGDRAGETGVSLRTALLKINWLKIGDSVVDLSAYDDQRDQAGNTGEDKPEDSVPAQPQAESKPDADVPVAVELDFTSDERGNPLQEVKLSKDDPDFERKKVKLKELGYRWNSDNQSWMLYQETEQRKAAAGGR